MIPLILYIIVLGFITFVNHRVLSRQRELINRQWKMLETTADQNDELILFCLQYIMKDSADKEDFEMAERCRKAIRELKKDKNTAG